MQQAPFFDWDEKAHVGYAHEIADLRLLEIERRPAVPESATHWHACVGEPMRLLPVGDGWRIVVGAMFVAASLFVAAAR